MGICVLLGGCTPYWRKHAVHPSSPSPFFQLAGGLSASGQPAVGENPRLGVAVNQIVDRFDAQIAILKANLRLTSDQNTNWGNLQSVLHDLATAKASLVRGSLSRDRLALQADQANPPQTSPSVATDPAALQNTDEQNGPLNYMRRGADEYADISTNLRKVTDALDPLYRTLDNRQRDEVIRFVNRSFAEMYDAYDGRTRGRR
jgi:hypothetical protein